MNASPSPTLSMIAVLARAGGEEVLRERFGEGPFLVVPAGGAAPVYLDDTPAFGSPLATRMVTTTSSDRSTTLSSMLDGRCLVATLAKSARNAFAMLLTIGRSPQNDVRLVAPTVSKLHATVRRAPDGRWMIRDAGSRNGTTVGVVRVAPQGEVPLTPGSSVLFGDLTCLFLDARGLLAMCRWIDKTP